MTEWWDRGRPWIKDGKRVLCAVVLMGTLGGCMSDREAQQVGKTFGEVLEPTVRKIAEGVSGGLELSYTARSFYRKNHRWPKDYTELSAFVQQSGGYLELSQYNCADFATLPDGNLLVTYVPQCETNCFTFTVEPSQK